MCLAIPAYDPSPGKTTRGLIRIKDRSPPDEGQLSKIRGEEDAFGRIDGQSGGGRGLCRVRSRLALGGFADEAQQSSVRHFRP